jgi:major vault protein
LGKVEQGDRPGRLFKENGMRIYDLEVLGIEIGDANIADLLTTTQHEAVEQSLNLGARQRALDVTQQTEALNRQIAEATAETSQRLIALQMAETEAQMQLALTQIESELATAERRLTARQSEQALLGDINEAELARERAKFDLEIKVAQERLAQRLQQLDGEVKAVVAKAEAVSPDLVAALQAFADKALAEKMAESMAPLAILGGKSIADVFAQLLQGTNLEEVIKRKALGQ